VSFKIRHYAGTSRRSPDPLVSWGGYITFDCIDDVTCDVVIIVSVVILCLFITKMFVTITPSTPQSW